MYAILEKSDLLNTYLKLFPNADKNLALKIIKEFIAQTYENNTLGARLVNAN